MRVAMVAMLVTACRAATPDRSPPAVEPTVIAPPPAPAARVAPAAAPPASLHDAAEAGDLAMLETLLAAGADLEATEPTYQHTPLLMALEFDEPEAALWLLERGASTAGATGRQALALAARGGAISVIDALIARGVGASGTFALHAAARYGHVAAVRRLLAAGEPVDEVEPDDRWTPLLVACMENHEDVARALLDAGASVSARDDDGNLPLHWAVFAARPEEVHEYRQLGGPHDTYFVPQQDAPLVALLLDRGAAVNARDGDGQTALHRAVLYQAANAIEVLLARGANRALRDRDGQTPRDLAVARGYADLATRLGR